MPALDKASVFNIARTSNQAKQPFNVAANYVADGGEGAQSSQGLGMFGDDTDGLFLSQVGYGNRKWYFAGLVCLQAWQ